MNHLIKWLRKFYLFRLLRNTCVKIRMFLFPPRALLSLRHLRGTGIEIGALHHPLPLWPSVKIYYVDRMSSPELRRHYPELKKKRLVTVDTIDDGQRLATFSEGQWDFVIANHLIEHTENPILALKNWVRVLKPGGRLFVTAPNKDSTFDRDRPVTEIQHLLQDYEGNAQNGKKDHFEEWVRLVDKITDAEVDHEVRRLMTIDYSIHFHVWDSPAFLNLLEYCKNNLGMPFEIFRFKNIGSESIAILTKI